MVTLYEPGATELLTASCREVLLDPGVTVVPLLNADVMPEGKPLIVNETGELKPFVTAMDGPIVKLFPACTTGEMGRALRVKLPLGVRSRQ